MIKIGIIKIAALGLFLCSSLSAMEKHPIYGSFSGRLSLYEEVLSPKAKAEISKKSDLLAFIEKQQNILQFSYDNQKIPANNLEVSLNINHKKVRGELCAKLRNLRPSYSTLQLAKNLRELAFMLAHADFEPEESARISRDQFSREFDIRIVESGFDFWLSHLQYGWPSKINWAGEKYSHEDWLAKIKYAGDYNAHVFFIEWITAMHFLQGICDKNKSVEDCALHFLRTFESKDSAERRIGTENEAFIELINSDFYPYNDTIASNFWQLIGNRVAIRERLESKKYWPGINKINLPVSIAIFTLFRLHGDVDTYKSAFASMKFLQASSGIDLNLKELRKVFSKFF